MRRIPVPLLVLLASLLLTAVATAFAAQAGRAAAEAQFTNAVQATQDRIAARLEAYIALLRGLAGLFAASAEVSAAEFRAYVERLDVVHRYPGVQGLGYSQRVRPGEGAALVARRRAEGMPEFELWPHGKGPEAHAILFMEPETARRREVLGFDMSLDPVRWEAMTRARDTGAETLSGKLTLANEPGEDRPAGFLLYVPVYRGGTVPTTLEARREALEGFVYSPFRADDLFAGIFGTEREPRVSFQVYDGPEEAPEQLLYDSRAGTPELARRPAFTARTRVVVDGRPWTLAFESRPALEQSFNRSLPAVIAGLGVLMSLALYVLTRAQAHARQSAERAVGLRDEFLSVAGHELRTPLTSLSLKLSGLSHAAASMGGPLAQRAVRDVEVAQRQVRNLADLISQLLDVTRISRQGLLLRREEVDLAAVVREGVEALAPQAERAGCAVEVHAEGPVVGRWDRLRLEQVVTNLMTNALKYGAGRPVRVAVSREGSVARLEVEDQGIGIEPEALQRIFDRFERAVSERHYGGLGLGLYITREVVEAHGGTISARSAPGRGATFTVELPLEQAQ